MQAINIIPKLTGSQTSAQVADQGYAYNQAGFTYNQASIDYGGIYKANQDTIPIIAMVETTPFNVLANTFTPKLTGLNTQAQLEDQGYTYNQSGLSFNQAGVDYGGIYNQNTDIIPMSMFISGDFTNIYTKGEESVGYNGPGFFMFINND